ncbi:MAG TPA: kelch repeat-containing protein [Blastocatellia bacterium]|nr:kelch repeat-containing protein [Blastocatellia bacterium]
MKRIALGLLSLALFALAVRAALQTGDRGAFSPLAPVPSVRQEISTAVLNGKIFVIAGFNSSGGNTSAVDVYDPQSNTWSPAAALPIATNHNAAAVAAGKLYAFGGTSTRTFVYNPQTNSWSDVAPMRFQHANTPAVGVINDKIYVAGGNGPNMNQTELEVYDPAMNAWTQLTSMSVPRNHTAGGVINGKFYVVGGRPGDTAAGALEVYDPATNGWTRLANMPTGRSGIGAGVVNGELYVFGGEQPRQFDNVEVYNPLNNTWTQLAPMPTPKHGIFTSVIGNKIYLPAGATQQGLAATNSHEVFTVNTATSVSAASFTDKLAAKAIVGAFGIGLATTAQPAPSQPLPTELGGVTVRITDSAGVTRDAPLFFVSPLQINYQIPAGAASGPAVVYVTGADGRVSTGAIQILSAAPALFTSSLDGQGPAVAIDGFTFTLPPFNSTRPNGQPNIIVFFGSGLGADATDLDGNVAANVQATIDGNPVVVQYAGRAPGFTGLNQLNLVLPAGVSSGTHNVQITRNGVASNVVTIAIR